MKPNTQNIRQRKRSSVINSFNNQFLDVKLFSSPPSQKHIQNRVQTYNSFSNQEIKNILEDFLELKKFKYLVCKALQLEYMYEPLIIIMTEEYGPINGKFKIFQIIQILINGRFYRKLPKQNQLIFIGNSKSTTTNINCLIAAIFTYSSGKLNLPQIQHILRVFEFQQKLNQSYPFGIHIDNNKISKILKKLQRTIKPMQFKQWIEDFKKITNSQRIQNYHFIYLITLTNTKIEENSYRFLNPMRNKQQKNIKQINEMQKQQKGNEGIKRNHNSLGQNQKYRIKSFSYQQKRQNLPSLIQFKNIKNQINLTESKLKQKRKCLSIHERIKSTYTDENYQNLNYQSQLTENIDKSNLYGSKLYSSKCSQNRHSIITQRSSRISTYQTNPNKQNYIFVCEMPPIPKIIPMKGNKKILLPSKSKKLVLNQDQNRINQNFTNIYKYNQKKIQKLLTDISNKC